MTDTSQHPQTDLDQRPEASAPTDPRLLSLAAEAWPARLPSRDLAGLPPAVFHALPIASHRSPLVKAASRLDRALPGWPERAAAAIDRAVSGGITPDLQRLCALLAHRSLRSPHLLFRAAGSAGGAEARLWLLTALAGTDTPPVRAFWLEDLRNRVAAEPDAPNPALWFAFLRAFLGGWLTYADFRGCLTQARILSAAHPNGDYRAALSRLRLTSDPTFAKWYRQVIYDIAHQPDVSLTFRAGGWIRDFPGEDYLWDALHSLARKPDSWWPLHVLRRTSGIDGDDERLLSDLSGVPEIPLGLLSLLRPDLCRAVDRAIPVPHHEAAVTWLKTASAARPLDQRWLESHLRPWADQAGRALVLAAGALCSTAPPPDFPGPEDALLRRREFVRGLLLPEFDRFMDNLSCLHALRREHFDAICQNARLGRPAAIRALSLWPEKAQESAPLLFRLSRGGSKSARRAARESLEVLQARSRVGDLAAYEKRLDLASAWADAGLDGKTARIWWDVAGYRIRLSVAGGKVTLHTYSGKQRLAGVPDAVRRDPQYPEIRQSRADLARTYRYFRRRFEEAMVENVSYRGRDFATLLANPVVRSLISRLILLVDGDPFLWDPGDPLAECPPPAEIESAAEVRIAHPLDLSHRGRLSQWQQHIIDSRTAQPFKQVFRECYLVGERERTADTCSRLQGNPLTARRAFALLRSRGYSPRRGDAVKDHSDSGLHAHIQWARDDEGAGRLLARSDTTERVTSGPVWFTRGDAGPLPLSEVPPIVFSETLRDADLLVSRAASGELGFTSRETLRLRATLVRYVARALGLTTIYVSDDSAHALIDGTRAMYRVHLGSGSVFLEESRRHLDMGAVTSETLRDLIAESVDSVTARILGLIGALTRDDQITDPHFLNQLPS